MKTIACLICVLVSTSISCKKSKPSPEPVTVDNPEVDTFAKGADSPDVPPDWKTAQSERQQAKAQYIGDHQSQFDWFANFAFSERDGIPYIALRLLPVLAPEIWLGDQTFSPDKNFLATVGLFMDERQPEYPMARGVGFSGLSRAPSSHKLDYASFTCGACHIGRVKGTDGKIEYIDGAVNTEFNLVTFRTKAAQTLEKVYDGETNDLKKAGKLLEAFVAAAETMHLQDKNFFYRDYSYDDKRFDAAYEAKQVALFIKEAALVLPLFAIRTDLELKAYLALVDKNYPGFQPEMKQGFGGMADATGMLTSKIYILAKTAEDELSKHKLVDAIGKALHILDSDPSTLLPPKPGLTDFMAVWEQGKRKVKWNKDQTRLMHGGGQWNGNIPIPMYRNMAAQLTFGLIGTDIRISYMGEGLLEDLPATVYPFDVDTTLAKRGHELFQKNCANCHRPHNGTVYEDMGTSLDRAGVVDENIAKSARSFFTKICSTTTTVDVDSSGQPGTSHPCAEFEGVSLEGKESLAMSPVGEHLGYNALPLGGTWAQAPYLHSGSVPTLFHLLVPDQRPTKFVKSRLSYDQEQVGYEWELPKAGQELEGHAYILDTSKFPAISNKGHDTNIEVDGETFKLNWSDDHEGAKAILEYMKTL